MTDTKTKIDRERARQRDRQRDRQRRDGQRETKQIKISWRENEREIETDREI